MTVSNHRRTAAPAMFCANGTAFDGAGFVAACRSRFPVGTADNLAHVSKRSRSAAEKWLAMETNPDIMTFGALLAEFGPALIAASFPCAPLGQNRRRGMNGAKNWNQNWRSSEPSPNFPRLPKEFAALHDADDLARDAVEGKWFPLAWSDQCAEGRVIWLFFPDWIRVFSAGGGFAGPGRCSYLARSVR